MNELNWAVAYKARASKFEDEFEVIVAVFSIPVNAEDFINNCMPKATKDRFYIKSLESGKTYKP